MLKFNFVFHPYDMTPFYEDYAQRYRWGWLKKQDLYDYVGRGLLTADWYKRITGDDYVAPQSQPTTPQS